MRKIITIKYNIRITNNLNYIFHNVEGEINEPFRDYKACDIFNYDNSDYNSVCDCIEEMAQTFKGRAEQGSNLYESTEISLIEFRIANEDGSNAKVFDGLDLKDLRTSIELFNAMVE